jgi:chromate transport protein ChrA
MTAGNIAVVILFCIFGAASGHALAENWRPPWQAAVYGLLLSAGARLTERILFAHQLHVSAQEAIGFFSLAVLVVGVTVIAFRFTLARKMPMQYPWLYERRGLFGWREKRSQVTRSA